MTRPPPLQASSDRENAKTPPRRPHLATVCPRKRGNGPSGGGLGGLSPTQAGERGIGWFPVDDCQELTRALTPAPSCADC